MLVKKLVAALIITTILALSVIQLPLTYAQEKPSTEILSTENVLFFLEDVCQIDITKYSISLVGPSIDHPYWLGGLTEAVGVYTLTSTTNTIEVSFRFVNNTLSWCLIDVRQGQLQSIMRPSTNAADAARDFLQRYQSFIHDESISAMSEMLSTINTSENSTKTSGNLALTATITPVSWRFSWANVYNNASFSGLGVMFQNGTFSAFGDDRSYVTIGSTEVNLNKEEAMSIALANAENYSYTFQNETVANLGILKDRINAELLTKAKDKPLVLYPYWIVNLLLDDLYPGFVTTIVVEIWADTAQVIEIYTLGIGGDLPHQSTSPSPSVSALNPTPTQSLQPTSSPSLSLQPTQTPLTELADNNLSTTWFILAAIIVVTVLALSALLLAKRK